MLHELDASMGEILNTLDRLNLAKDTLIVYSSDNGAYVTNENGHKPNGPYRGKKSQLWEGGHRVPFIIRWPGHLKPCERKELVSTIDIPATICGAAGLTVPQDALPDSYNLLPALRGEVNAAERDYLVIMSGTGHLALRSGDWKYIPNLNHAEGWQGGNSKPNAPARPALYDLAKDPSETQNLYAQQAQMAKKMAGLLEKARTQSITRPQ
jgi:arylsulfatase A-like enzyme